MPWEKKSLLESGRTKGGKLASREAISPQCWHWSSDNRLTSAANQGTGGRKASCRHRHLCVHWSARIAFRMARPGWSWVDIIINLILMPWRQGQRDRDILTGKSGQLCELCDPPPPQKHTSPQDCHCRISFELERICLRNRKRPNSLLADFYQGIIFCYVNISVTGSIITHCLICLKGKQITSTFKSCIFVKG